MDGFQLYLLSEKLLGFTPGPGGRLRVMPGTRLPFDEGDAETLADIALAAAPKGPQPAFAELAEKGVIRGRVLDAGCGTGEHALLAASLGLPALGVDMSPAAIAIAGRKATERGLQERARFEVHDALDLGSLDGQFDTVLDSGLFHVFSDEDRTRYAASLHQAVAPGGRYFMLCFSDSQPPGFGLRRISAQEILETFADGWLVDAIEPVTMDITLDPDGVWAWLTAATRI